MSTLYRADRVMTPVDPRADAMVVDDGVVTWVGARQDTGPGADRVVDLPGTWIAPAFVDAHAHLTETGLTLAGPDLRTATDLVEVLDLVAAAASAGGPVLGHGWDETRLRQGRPPTGEELERAAPGVWVYLARVDVHSAVISPALAQACGASDLDGWDPGGRVERDAHHAARDATRAALTPARRRSAQQDALRAAAAVGIAAVHEMSAPHLAPEDDLRELVALAADPTAATPQVFAYWGEPVAHEQEARRVLDRLSVPIAGLAGDLCVDGSIGSRTAAWRQEYADRPGASGRLYLDVAQIRDHVAACTRAGIPAGFHVIGDAAVDAVRRGVRRAAERVGIAAVRAGGHRVEHVEAIDAEGIADLVDLGVVASVQPAFDAIWGGPDGLYASRLGGPRAEATNPLRALAAAGVTLAFGSDSPVTPFDPWGAVRAAVHHRTERSRLDLATAFAAHTVGGWRAAGVRDAGVLRPGARATFAAWPLPHPAGGACVLTVLDGRVLYDVRTDDVGR